MSGLVHIKLSDGGWIQERQAQELARRLPYVTCGLTEDTNARIQYYMTYGSRVRRVSPIEIGFFTHQEPDPAAAATFQSIARSVAVCVAMADATATLIRSLGVSGVEIISPGVDLNAFHPVVRIGVVGRTYHTGRKGEDLVAAVMDVPGLEWHFTGHGWPGPARHIPDEEMPGFYRSLDYVLVPAYNEGGPMCVLEALACGCPVIAPAVGWVPQFPHVEFELGSIADLRRVLTECVERKRALRRPVEAYSWRAWVEKHHALFVRLLGHDPMAPATIATTCATPATENATGPRTDISAALVVHGWEADCGRGGPSVRAPRTAQELQRLGVPASCCSADTLVPADHDVVHVYNVWPPFSCEEVLKRIEASGAALVLSPIALDFAELDAFNSRVPGILEEFAHPARVQALLSALAKNKHTLQDGYPKLAPIARYHSVVRRLASYADHLILLSHHEQDVLSRMGIDHPSVSIVRNAVDPAALHRVADGSLFFQKFGIRDYALCIGAIEPRKNQAMLAFALRDTGIPLVLIGHAPDPGYAQLVRRIGGGNLTFCGRLPSNSEILASAYAGARVFCLPSWAEGASLAALEAAAAGCRLVLSNRSSELEYFGAHARYIDPLDPDSIRQAVLAACAEGMSDSGCTDRQPLSLASDWHAHATDTLAAYRRALDTRRCAQVSAQPVMPPSHIDLGNSARWLDGPGEKFPPTCHLQAELGSTLGKPRCWIATDPDSGQLQVAPPPPASAGPAVVPSQALSERMIRFLHRSIFPSDGLSEDSRPQPQQWLSDIPAAALSRYAFAASRMAPGSRVIDLSCGPGYGPYLIATQAKCRIEAIDESAALVAFACENWGHSGIDYSGRKFSECWQPDPAGFDYAVAFASMELERTPLPFLRRAFQHLKPGGTLFFTLPYGSRLPGNKDAARGARAFHKETQALAALSGLAGDLDIHEQSANRIWRAAIESGDAGGCEAIIGVWRKRNSTVEVAAGMQTSDTGLFVYRAQENEIKSFHAAMRALLAARWNSLVIFFMAMRRRRGWIRNHVPVFGGPMAFLLGLVD
ncbi:MAG: putative group 1 glycosyltransferase (modular protein) [Rhodocyclaceae bacterium]|nr:MAG: putative group 1 glycosyltransferase (modular protein) [Rhodocyclaceae bacterium]TND04934.1 MAG: putative group 1 glycosyltransferase (modular protein) [Rhodocyclaceae bacterium]